MVKEIYVDLGTKRKGIHIFRDIEKKKKQQTHRYKMIGYGETHEEI